MAKKIEEIKYLTDIDVQSLMNYIKAESEKGWTIVGGVTPYYEAETDYKDEVIQVRKYAAIIVQYTEDV